MNRLIELWCFALLTEGIFAAIYFWKRRLEPRPHRNYRLLEIASIFVGLWIIYKLQHFDDLNKINTAIAMLAMLVILPTIVLLDVVEQKSYKKNKN